MEKRSSVSFDAVKKCAFVDVLHTPGGYTGQIHFNVSLFRTALLTAKPLNDGGFK